MSQRKKFLLFTGLALLLAAAGILFTLQRPRTTVVEIIQDNEVLYRLDLAQAEDQTIQVEYEGRVNVVEIRDHQIHMLEAECPDKTCVDMGWLDSAAPIVCLPNHLVIQFADNAGLDGATA